MDQKNFIVAIVKSGGITESFRSRQTQCPNLRHYLFQLGAPCLQRIVYQDTAGRVPTMWPDFTWKFWFLTRRFDAVAYLQRERAPATR